jgi:tripartite-type tricarboxylate transporter receptor subunit TctC
MRAGIFAAIALVLAANSAAAQNYPARPIKLVVPFAAGGPGDTVGRLLAQSMTKGGQTVVVENISGAGGNIGATYVSRAAPDGYTMLFHQLGMAISPFLYSKLEYNPLDFETIGMVAYQANVLVTRPKIAPGSFQDFIAYLKANREKLSFASTGPGGASDLCAILFKSSTGIDIKTVPYRATAPALTDILGGNVDLLCDSVATATPYIQAKSVEAHGVTTLTRASSLPDVPTLDEQGLKGFDMTTWTALYAPKGTPKPIVEHLSKSLQQAVQDPQFNASLHKVGSNAQPKEKATPEAHAAYLRQEMKRWGPIIQAAKAKAK